MPRIFFSHAGADRNVAALIADHVERKAPESKVFASSRAGDIPPSSESWLAAVQAALRDSDLYVVLLTPNSVQRPWVWFEYGAAWYSRKRVILVCAGGLQASEVPSPLCTKQLYSLESPDEARALLQELGLEGDTAEELSARVRELASQARFAGVDEGIWEAVRIDGDTYAWAGPLVALDDRPAIAPPPQLEERLRERGLKPYWARRDKLRHHFGRGRAQVYATDRKSWKRPIGDQDLILLAGGLDDAPEEGTPGTI